MEKSMVWLSRIDACVGTVVQCMNKQETGGDQQQKLYADTQGITFELGKTLMTGNVRVFVQYWAGMRWRMEPVVRGGVLCRFCQGWKWISVETAGGIYSTCLISLGCSRLLYW